MTSTTTATTTLVYRGVAYSSGSGSYRVKSGSISRSLHRIIELQFLGNHYQRAW